MRSLALLIVVTPLVTGLRLQMPDEVYKGDNMELASMSGDTFNSDNLDFNRFDDYAGIFSIEEEKRLQARQDEYWQMENRDNQGLFKSLKGNPTGMIYFVYTRYWSSCKIRAGEAMEVVKTAGFNAKQIPCDKFCALPAEDVSTATVIHVKFICACEDEDVKSMTSSPTFPAKVSEKGAIRIYDPVDAPQLANLTDCSNLKMGILTGTNDLRDAFNKMRPQSAFTLPHHHSNFQHIRHQSSLNQKLRIVQAGDASNYRISRVLETCLRATLDKEALERVDPWAQLLKTVNCTEKTEGPSHRGHCYAQKLAQFDIAIVWEQGYKNMSADPRNPALIKPPQRLANALSVGIPAVAHTSYSGHHDAAAFGQDAVHLVANEQEMCDRIVQLITDRTLYKKAAEQALEVAEKYSPIAVGSQYAEAFKYFKN